jgi:hypothetical protein
VFDLGAVLSQQQGDAGHAVCYANRSLAGAGRTYSATHKEALAVNWAMRKFRPCALGRLPTIFTDHRTLDYMDKVQDTTDQLHRWALEI